MNPGQRLALAGPVLIDLDGVEIGATEREMLRHPAVGGVVLFARNHESKEQLAGLCRAIHAIDARLLVTVDQEGGRVQRFLDDFVTLPPMAALGAWYDMDTQAGLALAFDHGLVMAAELRGCGVDGSWAPVLDLQGGNAAIIGHRALHHDPAVVAALGRAHVAGMRAGGLGAAIKHFPGHGGVEGDSHHMLPHDGRPLDALWHQDLLPFRVLIEEGMAEAVMMAHVVYESVDEWPASLSSHWISTILRQRMGFAGVVVADDLTMAGAACGGSWLERAVLARNAGCDLLPVLNDRSAQEAILDGWPAAVLPVCGSWWRGEAAPAAMWQPAAQRLMIQAATYSQGSGAVS